MCCLPFVMNHRRNNLTIYKFEITYIYDLTISLKGYLKKEFFMTNLDSINFLMVFIKKTFF